MNHANVMKMLEQKRSEIVFIVLPPWVTDP